MIDACDFARKLICNLGYFKRLVNVCRRTEAVDLSAIFLLDDTFRNHASVTTFLRMRTETLVVIVVIVVVVVVILPAAVTFRGAR